MNSEEDSKQELAITPIKPVDRHIIRPIFIYIIVISLIVAAFFIGFFKIAPEKFLSLVKINNNIVTSSLISVMPTTIPPQRTAFPTRKIIPSVMPPQPTVIPTIIPTLTITPIAITLKPSCNEAESINKAKDCTLVILVENSEGYGHGSGFSIQSGYIVTSFHIIENIDRINTYINGEKENLMVWGTSKNDDLAVLKLNTPIPTCKWSDSQALGPVETVYAVGWPMSSEGESTITNGRFDRIYRTPQGLEFIQVNAITKPGNSGGPLINKCGVVGIHTSGTTVLKSIGISELGITPGEMTWSSQFKEEVSLAISSNYAIPIINNLIQNGSVKALPIK